MKFCYINAILIYLDICFGNLLNFLNFEVMQGMFVIEMIWVFIQDIRKLFHSEPVIYISM